MDPSDSTLGAAALRGQRLASHANVVLTSEGLVVPARVDRPRTKVSPLLIQVLGLLSLPEDERDLGAGWIVDAPAGRIDEAVGVLRERGLIVEGSSMTSAEPGSPREAAAAASGHVRVVTPVILHPWRGRFVLVDGAGALRASWSAEEVLVVEQFRHPRMVESVRGADRILAPLVGTPWLAEVDPSAGSMAAETAVDRVRRAERARTQRFVEASERSLHQLCSQPAESGGRVPVYPVGSPVQSPNTALGLILAYAQAYQGGRLRDRYDLRPYWNVRRGTVRRLLEERGPGVFLFSSYLWSSASNLALSALVKELSPESVTIHGGPDVPRYERDVEHYLRRHPHVDVVGRNEGEATVAEILDALDGELGAAARRRLRDVPGIAYLDGDEVVRTADRDRFADLDVVPSPFLSGVFQTFEDATAPMAILESNRGCPYGCTFCDWGSATASRIRQFSLDRVKAELDWVAEHRVERLILADANFGILARDVEIAEYVAHLHTTTGYPRFFQASNAKNTIKHLDRIIEVLVDSGLTSVGCLSLQTVDADTLATVHRSNIRTEKYLELAATFRRKRLPLFTELMLGLPGSTFESFVGDLQFSVDHEVPARIYLTELLVNTPMNEPSYRERYQITAEPLDLREITGQVAGRRPNLVVSSSSFSREDLERSLDLRAVYSMCENYGILRHVSRFVRHETGVREADLYRRLLQRVQRAPEAYPSVRWAFDTMADVAVPPVSWAWFYADVRSYLVNEIGVEDDDALNTVLIVQQALVPDRGREFPRTFELPHDYVAWFADVMGAKEVDDVWTDRVPRLRTFGPGSFTVDDPVDLCGSALGRSMDLNFAGQWEFDSPVSRPMTGTDEFISL